MPFKLSLVLSLLLSLISFAKADPTVLNAFEKKGQYFTVRGKIFVDANNNFRSAYSSCYANTSFKNKTEVSFDFHHDAKIPLQIEIWSPEWSDVSKLTFNQVKVTHHDSEGKILTYFNQFDAEDSKIIISRQDAQNFALALARSKTIDFELPNGKTLTVGIEDGPQLLSDILDCGKSTLAIRHSVSKLSKLLDATIGAPAKGDPFLVENCHGGICTWYRIVKKLEISSTESGRLVGASTEYCTKSHDLEENKSYPKTYQCREKELEFSDFVAYCSAANPSLSYQEKSDKNKLGKWARVHLSISDDGIFGYNRWAANLYLNICHNFDLNKNERLSFDFIGAKFGYKSRAKTFEAFKSDDVVDAISDIPTKPLSKLQTTAAPSEHSHTE